MTRKKVLFLITKATWGGAQRYVYDLATHLPQEYEAVVAYGEAGRLADMLEKVNIERRPLPALGRDVAFISDISSFFQIIVCLWRVRPDVVHLNSSKAAALGAFAARLMFVPTIIFTVHGWPFKEKRNELARIAIYVVSWLTAFFSHTVIVVSKTDEAQGKKMALLGKKIHYVAIGIEPPQFLSREEASASLSISTALLRIVTIAELTENKGMAFALEALSLLREKNVDVSYSVIGDGEARGDLEQDAEKLNVADRIHFLGFLPEAGKYLKAFDMFLLPSIKEGMPYVLLEAAAAGLPIITTSVVNPEFIELAGNVHVVPPADSGAIADAIKEVLNEEQEQELLPINHYFSLKDMVERTIALYR